MTEYWLLRVPGNERDRINPLANAPDATAAGSKIFHQHCAKCHGDNGQGKVDRKHVRPNLHSFRVKQATPGELFWLLTNGSRKTECRRGVVCLSPNAGRSSPS